jgi:glycosyltransferase involved in cell wall biosynthesis
VCTASGTTDFARDGETAVVVRRNSFALGRAIDRLIDDPDRRNRLAEAGLRRAREFPWERTADRLLEVIGLG